MRFRPKLSLIPRQFGTQLATIFAAITSLTIAFVTLKGVEEQTTTLTTELYHQTQAIAENLAIASAQFLVVRDYTSIENMLTRAAKFPTVTLIEVIDVEGSIVGSVEKDHQGTIRARYGVAPPSPPKTNYPTTRAHKEGVVVWYPITLAQHIGWVKVSQSNSLVDEMKGEIWSKNIHNGAVILLILFILVVALLRRPSRSLSRYTAFADRLNERFGEQLEVDESSLEFKRLGIALNRASQRIYNQDQAIRKILNDLERVAAMAEHCPHLIFSLNRCQEILYANQAAIDTANLFKLEQQALTKLLPPRLLSGCNHFDTETLAAIEEETFYEGHTFLWTFSFLQEQGVLHCYAIDISQRKVTENALRSSETHYRTLFHATNDAIFLIDNQTIVDCNTAAALLFRCPPQALLHQSHQQFIPTRLNGKEGSTASPHPHTNDTAQTFEGEITRPDGTAFMAEIDLTRIELEGKTTTLAIVRNISERKSAEEALIKQANFDALTGLPNRILVLDRLTHAIKVAHRENHLVAVMFVDLDRFKHVNDSFGHATGDKLLLEVAVRLQQAIRESDTVGRLGGDEFLIILDIVEDPLEPENISERILQMMTKSFLIDGHEFYLGASIGISIYPTDSHTPHELMRNADSAMYQSKGAGRNSFTFYTQELNEKAKLRVVMEAHLQHAIENNELYLAYQPKFDARTEEIIGAEALLRWHNPELGEVPPEIFIPLAEDNGLIVDIGEWVLESACHDLMQWQNLYGRNIQVAINISTRQFQSNALLNAIRRTIADSGVTASLLKLEITESLLIADSPELIPMLRAIKAEGIYLSLDDFGTGYSSLSYLKRFPFDELKIDRAFVNDITTDPDDAALCEAIIIIAKTLGMEVVAEGAETTEQVEFLCAHGVDTIQGYFYSRPLTMAAFTALLEPATANLLQQPQTET